MRTRGDGIRTRSRLERLARREAPAASRPAAPGDDERCELCGEAIEPRHRHLLDLRDRELMCSCRACSTLFDSGAAGGGHYRLVPDRVLRLAGFELDRAAWERLRIPVEIAFFIRFGEDGRTKAFYPGPMGPTESHLGLEAWTAIAAANPVLGTMVDDVEALLVDRTGADGRAWLVPIEECYGLVAVMRLNWKGLSGGDDVWRVIASFFAALDARSRPPRPNELQGQANAVAGVPAEGG